MPAKQENNFHRSSYDSSLSIVNSSVDTLLLLFNCLFVLFCFLSVKAVHGRPGKLLWELQTTAALAILDCLPIYTLIDSPATIFIYSLVVYLLLFIYLF